MTDLPNAAGEELHAIQVPLIPIQLKPGDILAFKFPEGAPLGLVREQITGIKDQLEGLGMTGILFVALTNGTDLSKVSEEDMRQAGWVRAEKPADKE